MDSLGRRGAFASVWVPSVETASLVLLPCFPGVVEAPRFGGGSVGLLDSALHDPQLRLLAQLMAR